MSKFNRVVNNPHEFRKQILEKLDNILKDKNISENLEKGIYNYTIMECEEKKLIKMEKQLFCLKLFI